ncbi:TetR/AcrR family transcriptional regulator [Thermomonospora umbrina]|uniref:TetR family transcriptional regulator n=1 Tax=Thermomonospora umbrina TaxID=111806 RepID=A0A3D9SV50_9ACTN|nr:TetR/AcrR family transcriptional regulator [Thermomonospora umbrina]REE99832.1 TetR family transcriptional regulator [Thermomonospora umbrina]
MARSGPTGRYGGRPAAERRAERRARLLEAGLELFGTDGYAATSVERLCTTAGLSTRQFYEEFANREAVLIALHDQVNRRAFDAVTVCVEALDTESGRPGTDVDVEQLVRAALRGYITVTAADLRWARVAYVEVVGASPEVEARRVRWRRRWAELLETAATTAGLLGDPVSPRIHLGIVGFIGAVNALAHEWCTASPRLPLETVIDTLAALFLSGVLGR